MLLIWFVLFVSQHISMSTNYMRDDDSHGFHCLHLILIINACLSPALCELLSFSTKPNAEPAFFNVGPQQMSPIFQTGGNYQICQNFTLARICEQWEDSVQICVCRGGERNPGWIPAPLVGNRNHIHRWKSFHCFSFLQRKCIPLKNETLDCMKNQNFFFFYLTWNPLVTQHMFCIL